MHHKLWLCMYVLETNCRIFEFWTLRASEAPFAGWREATYVPNTPACFFQQYSLGGCHLGMTFRIQATQFVQLQLRQTQEVNATPHLAFSAEQGRRYHKSYLISIIYNIYESHNNFQVPQAPKGYSSFSKEMTAGGYY